MKKILLTSLVNRFFLALCLTLAFAAAAFAQTNISFPIVTIQATDAKGTWTGDPAVFTVYRADDLAQALNVYCCISGTASNGVDYQNISSFVSIPAYARSNTIVIHPINLGQTNIRTVTVDLCPSPLMSPMMPVNYLIGSPSNATVYVTPAVSNLPPVVNIFSPTNNAVFNAPANISLLARATGLGNPVTNVDRKGTRLNSS